jgi:hypothetical protein
MKCNIIMLTYLGSRNTRISNRRGKEEEGFDNSRQCGNKSSEAGQAGRTRRGQGGRESVTDITNFSEDGEGLILGVKNLIGM